MRRRTKIIYKIMGRSQSLRHHPHMINAHSSATSVEKIRKKKKNQLEIVFLKSTRDLIAVRYLGHWQILVRWR